MTNKKSTKKALISSALCLLLCLSMLVGTTFAWFTDSVGTTNNIITAGNLDVNLQWKTSPDAEWADVTSNTNIFKTGTLWEPGHTEVVYLKVSNEGSLALKYSLDIAIASETAGTNVANESFKLSDHILYNIYDGVKSYADSAAARGDESGDKLNTPYNKASQLLNEGDYVEMTLVVFMPTTVGNEANYLKDTTTPTINLGINLYATQYTKENDSFGPNYDGDALVCDILAKPETINDILATVEPGTVIGLAAGKYGTITLTQNDLTLVSNSAVVDCLDLNEKDNIIVDGLTFNAAGAQTAYDAKGAASNNVTNLTDGKANNGGSVGVLIKNCAFVGEAADANLYFPIYFGDTNRGNRSDEITIENCEFKTNARQYIALNGVTSNSGKTAGQIVIKNNVFGGAGFGTTHNTIQATGQGCNWTITGNKFYNWNTEKTAIGSSRNGSDNLTWTITGNDFCNEDGAVVLALKTSYTTANTTLVFENNTVWGGNGTIASTPVNAENEAVFGGHKLQMNDNVVMVDTDTEFTDALKTATNGSVILLTNNVTVTSDWDARYTGGKTSKEVVLDGAGSTLKITGKVADNNYNAVFRFEADAVVRNITIDLSEASGYNGKQARAISAKGNLIVDNCTFIGNTAVSNTRAIIFGEGQTANQFDAEISITNCTFVNWKRGITDAESLRECKTVVIEGNTCENAPIYVSAYESVTVMNNTMSGCLINVTSYTAAGSAKVVVTGNVLDASKYNVVGSTSKLFDAANITVQEGFVVNTIA